MAAIEIISSGGGSGDTSAPTVPQNVTAAAFSTSRVDVSWDASTDLGGGVVAGYKVYRDDIGLLATVTGTSYSDTTVAANTTYNYQVSAIDNAVPANESALSTPLASATTPPPASGGTDIRVNVGGDQYTDGSGNVWQADNGYNTGMVSGSGLGVADIFGTTDDQLYRTQRFDPATAPEMSYSFAVPNGDYTVKLHFAENYSGVFYTGGRVFSVAMEGVTVISGLDVYATVGANTALVRSVPVTVLDGQLNIQFLHQAENPIVAAIEIISSGSMASASAPVASLSGGAYSGPVDVSLSTATAGGDIYYTTDGSTPNATSALYSGTPLTFTGNTTLKAITIANGYSDSAVTTQVYSVDPATAGVTLFSDDFNDGNASGWTVVNNCIYQTSAWSVVSNVYKQTGKCNGTLPVGAVVGSYALSSAALPGNVDIQLRLRGEDPALDGVPGNDDSDWKYGAIGVLFGYQDANNYYRFEMNALKGYRKLWRRQGGVLTELSISSQSYVGGQWVTLRIVHQNGVILVFMDGQEVSATRDGTFSNTRLGLFCSGNSSCSFDDIVVKGAPSEPMLGLNLPDGGVPTHAQGEYFVDTDGTLNVSGFATLASGVGGIEFVVDGAQTVTDLTPPYTAQFSGLATGVHTISGHLLDGSSVRLSAAGASVTLPEVGSRGIHLYSVGDSITLGLFDYLSTDDVSLDGRNTGGGYEPVLNNYLSADSGGKPVTVWNDGTSGETTLEGLAHATYIVARTPAVQAYLFGYGTNDSGGSLPLSSGLGLNPGDSGYAGSYKDYVQQYIDTVTAAGKRIYLAKIPPFLASATRDATVQQYNLVIDELVSKLKTNFPSSYVGYVPPDFHTYFTDNPGEIGSDGIHPTGAGYASMGRLWCNALNGQMGLTCIGGP